MWGYLTQYRTADLLLSWASSCFEVGCKCLHVIVVTARLKVLLEDELIEVFLILFTAPMKNCAFAVKQRKACLLLQEEEAIFEPEGKTEGH